jgi:serine/threonine-protein kinase ATR
VKKILERVLYKHPEQAMWHLAWLRGSKNEERSKFGEEIFKAAQKVLSNVSQEAMAALIRESGSLFNFLKELAKHSSDKKNVTSIAIKPWQGDVDLEQFIPPVQAALSMSPSRAVKGSSKEYFPRVFPRMRAFSSKVAVMSSKAKPKKIIAYAVPGSWKHGNGRSRGSKDQDVLDTDIGEIHFLVKQEATGDLRKDARVQDFNNVINRLMDSSNHSTSSLISRSRRLRLRTFAVTCLSEDTGILEWVPDTDSLRNLISKSYNPQTAPFSPRRRGVKLANFGDATLRLNYERCQNQFFKEGNLQQAVKMYHQLCLKQMPPLFHWWFVQTFNTDAHAWYEARLRFTLSAAAWSMVGHVIGLGDRHSENILVETTTGRVVHVDFDWYVLLLRVC